MTNNIFVFCLSIGVIYSAFSIVFHFFAALDFGFDFDLGLESHFDIFLPIKPFTVMVFLTVFGGVGLITEKVLGEAAAVVVSLAAAYAVALFLYRGVYVTLQRAQTETKGVFDAIGAEATILESIPVDGLGRISYIVDGNILSGVAKAIEESAHKPIHGNDGGELAREQSFKKGKKVYIHDFMDGVYYVGVNPYRPAITAVSEEKYIN